LVRGGREAGHIFAGFRLHVLTKTGRFNDAVLASFDRPSRKNARHRFEDLARVGRPSAKTLQRNIAARNGWARVRFKSAESTAASRDKPSVLLTSSTYADRESLKLTPAGLRPSMTNPAKMRSGKGNLRIHLFVA